MSLLIFSGAAGLSHGQTIQVSVAMPVTNQAVTITVPGLAAGGIINITDSHAVATQLLANAQSQATWTPSRYGKHAISSGAATQTMWVTTRPMTLHWWNADYAQTNVTVVMTGSAAAWNARGVVKVGYVADNGYTDPHQWTNDWASAGPQGFAFDELYLAASPKMDSVAQACALERQAQGPDYSMNIWEAGIDTSTFGPTAAILKANNVNILIEDFYGDWGLHTSRWAAVTAVGLQNNAFSGIWPGTAPLTNEAAVRADIALVRLAAPFANGIAMFAVQTDNYSPPNLAAELAACDQAIEDFYLKPLIHLSVNSSAQLIAWNLGNDDATGFSLQFLNGGSGILTNIDLSSLTPNGQMPLNIPGGAVYAKVINPAGTANLYTGNSLYNTGLYLINAPGRYVWTNDNGDALWNTFSDWWPHGPPPGNIDSGNYAYFDSGYSAPISITAASGETSITSVQFATAGWTITGDAANQDFYTYNITSSGAGTNTINIGISARDVVPASFTVNTGNTLIFNGLVGAVRNNGGVLKDGAGTLILTYANTFTGPSTINAGTLLVNGSIGNGAVTITSGATLGGSGTINGPVTVNGTLAPAALTIQNNTTITGSATLQYRLGTVSDTATITGNLALAGTFNIADAGGFGIGTYTLFTYTGTFTSSGVALGSTPGNSFIYTFDTNTVGQVKLMVTYTPFVAWQMARFGFTNGIAAADADPDGDSLANLIEYTTGTDPQAGNANPILSDRESTNGFAYLRLSLNRDTNATDVVIQGLSAGALTNWTTDTVIESNTPSFFRVRDADPIEANSQRFLKLRFLLP